MQSTNTLSLGICGIRRRRSFHHRRVSVCLPAARQNRVCRRRTAKIKRISVSTLNAIALGMCGASALEFAVPRIPPDGGRRANGAQRCTIGNIRHTQTHSGANSSGQFNGVEQWLNQLLSLHPRSPDGHAERNC